MLIFQVLVGAGVVFLRTASHPDLMPSPSLSSTVWRLCPHVIRIGLCSYGVSYVSPCVLLCSDLFLMFLMCLLCCVSYVFYSTVFPMHYTRLCFLCVLLFCVSYVFYSTVFPMCSTRLFPLCSTLLCFLCVLLYCVSFCSS